MYFVRTNTKGVGEKAPEADMAAGEINPDSLQSYRTLLTELYMPLLTAQDALGKATKAQTSELLQVLAECQGHTGTRHQVALWCDQAATRMPSRMSCHTATQVLSLGWVFCALLTRVWCGLAW